MNLIKRRVSRVELTRQIIKARLTTGLPDFPFLNGSHRVEITLYAAHPFATAGAYAASLNLDSFRKNCRATYAYR